MIRGLLVGLVATLALGVTRPPTSVAQQDAPTRNGDSIAVTFLLEDDLRSQRERIRVAERELAEIRRLLEALGRELVTDPLPRPTDLDVALTRVRRALTALENLAASRRPVDTDDFYDAVSDLDASLRGLLPNEQEIVTRRWGKGMGLFTESEGQARRVFDRAYAAAEQIFREGLDRLAGRHAWVRDAMPSARWGIGVYRSADDSGMFAGPEVDPTEIGRFAARYEALNKSTAVQEIEQLYEELDRLLLAHQKILHEHIENAISSREKEIAELRDAVNEGVSELAREKALEAERRAAVDQRLVIAVYLMIGAAVALFLALWILPAGVAELVVKRRSLVEIIGTAFMLVTVIILATGNHLSKEILGTLLGTIAGYIFGRAGQQPSSEG
jgi:hypothetical protein